MLSDRELMVIGGSEVYRQFMPLADRLYITQINHEFVGDTYFPEYDQTDYNVITEQVAEENGYELTFKILEKKISKNS
jgi:dihydrofolate reductase